MAKKVQAREELRQLVKQAHAGILEAEWELVWRLHAVCTSEPPAFEEWGFRSRKEWVKADLESMADSTVSRLVGVAKIVGELPEEERQKWQRQTVWACVEVMELAKTDPAEALVQVSSGKPQWQLRKAVAEKRKDLHLDSEYARLTLTLPKAVFEKWVEAKWIAAFAANEPSPNDAKLFEFIVADWRSEMETVVQKLQEPWRSMLLNGEYRCLECGSRRDLERHHVIARSKGKRGHRGPQVLLCHGCHEKVTQHWDGNYRKYAQKWGFGEEYAHADMNLILD